jgi:hypothetical protein
MGVVCGDPQPVVHGAGGMMLIDPLYQRAVADVAQAHGVPVVLDEVFTGCYRLGPPSTAGLLGVREGSEQRASMPVLADGDAAPRPSIDHPRRGHVRQARVGWPRPAGAHADH